MNYLEYSLKGALEAEEWEVLIAMLDSLGYEGFVQDDSGMLAYIQEEKRDETAFANLMKRLAYAVEFTSRLIPEVNWNEKWEQDFKAVEVGDRVRVRASFHPKEERFEYDILIDPKMSFGTGHHSTTRLMVEGMLAYPFTGASVLDMGCGTGVLSILASKMGAEKVLAIDIEEWAYHNALENVEKNKRNNIEVLQGDAGLIKGHCFDIILANINRNVLLEDMSHYFNALDSRGTLLISGILDIDESVILKAAEEAGFMIGDIRKEQNWLSIVLSKNDSHEKSSIS